MDHIKPVKTAVIGCGMISNIYIRNLKNLFHIIDLTAVCDVRSESADHRRTSEKRKKDHRTEKNPYGCYIRREMVQL